MAYLLDTPTLAEALRAAPSRELVRRLTSTSTGERWTSVITVGQLLAAARRAAEPRLMQDVLRLVASVRVAAFDLAAAQAFAKLRASVPSEVAVEDVAIAAIATAHSLILVSPRREAFAPFTQLRVEDWLKAGS
jgi:tRNA(fMet)-specific endonuclease VapC